MTVCTLCGCDIPGNGPLCTNCRNNLLSQTIATQIPTEQQNKHYEDQWEYPSRSNPALVYKVSRLGDDFACSCPVWKFRRKLCAHIQDVQQTLALQTAPAAEQPTAKRRRFRFDT